jgi:hypothetical protein
LDFAIYTKKITGPGTDYLAVLYSKRELDIAAIRDAFARAVGSDYIRPFHAAYESGRISFTAASANSGAVFGLLPALPHR